MSKHWTHHGEVVKEMPKGMTAFVYVIRTPDGRYYIGHTSKKNGYWKSYKGGGSTLREYYKTNDWRQCRFLVVQFFKTKAEALDAEVHLIEKTGAFLSEKYFNIQKGGTLGNAGLTFNHTDEAKQKIQDASKKKWQDPEFREKRAEAMEHVFNDPEYRKNQGLDSKNRWKDPEYREKMVALWTPEARMEMGKKISAKWENPTQSMLEAPKLRADKLKKIIVVDGVEFLGIQTVADFYNVPRDTIVSWLRGQSRTYLKHDITMIHYKGEEPVPFQSRAKLPNLDRPNGMRECKTCGNVKPKSDFSRGFCKKYNTERFAKECKSCGNAKRAERRKADPEYRESINRTKRKWRDRNKERINKMKRDQYKERKNSKI